MPFSRRPETPEKAMPEAFGFSLLDEQFQIVVGCGHHRQAGAPPPGREDAFPILAPGVEDGPNVERLLSADDDGLDLGNLPPVDLKPHAADHRTAVFLDDGLGVRPAFPRAGRPAPGRGPARGFPGALSDRTSRPFPVYLAPEAAGRMAVASGAAKNVSVTA